MKFFQKIFLLLGGCLLFALLFFCPTVKAEISLKLITGELTFKGSNIVYNNAQLTMHTEAGSWNMKAKQIFYFPKQKKILLQGAVEIQNQSLKITAEEMEADTRTGFFNIEKGLIQDTKNQIEIQAAKIQQKEDALYELDSAFFTSCVLDEKKKNKTWHIFFQKTTYRVNNFASGINSLFYLKKIPIFYSPFLAWPTVLDRKSGLLPPSLSYRAGDLDREYGIRLQIPYFFNISPHTDYSLTLDYIQNRGVGLDSEFHNLGRQNRETEIRLWYLKENIQAREEGGQNFFLQRHFFSLFHRNHFAKNGNIFIESFNQSDSQIKEDYFSSKDYALSNTQARKDKIQLGYQWKSGKISVQAERDFDFTNANSRLNTDFTKEDLLTTNFQQSYFFAPYFKIDFQSKWEVFDFEQEENWEGERLTINLKNQFLLGNSFFFFEPQLTFTQKNYQATISTSDENISLKKNFNIKTYPSFALDTGLNFEKFIKAGKWIFQPKILYEQTPEQSEKRLLVSLPENNYYEASADTLFDSQDTILAKNIAQFSLLWDFQKYQTTEKQFSLEFSVVYDLDPNHATEDIENRNGSYIPLAKRENALSLEQAIMPVHLRTKWMAAQNLQFSYFTRYDIFAGKDLEQLAEINYTKGKNTFVASYHKNLRFYTNFNNDDFYKKDEWNVSFKNSLSEYWDSSLLLKRNNLIEHKHASLESDLVGQGIDEVILKLTYNDCCTIAQISMYEKVVVSSSAENSFLDRGLSLNFQLKSQF